MNNGYNMPYGMMPNSNMMMPQGVNPNMGMNNEYNYLNELENKVARIERQIKRLDQRVTRLESPYGIKSNGIAKNNIGNISEPDDNMYMM